MQKVSNPKKENAFGRQYAQILFRMTEPFMRFRCYTAFPMHSNNDFLLRLFVPNNPVYAQLDGQY